MSHRPEPETLSFVLGANEAYFPGLLATVYSTLISLDPKHPVEFFIFDGGIELESKELLESRSKQLRSDSDIHWLKADLSPFRSLVPMNGNFMAYARLLIPDLIDRPRVVWLDCDILVLRDLAPLARLDLEGLAIGACLESEVATLAQDVSNLHELGVPEDAPYYNTGVLSMDLNSLRDIDFTRLALKYLKKNHGKYCWHDQSAINVVMHGKIKTLPSCWNTLNTSSASEMVQDIEPDINAYHFLQHPKPWQRYEGDYFSRLFYELLKIIDCLPVSLNSARNRLQALKWSFPSMTIFYFQLRSLFSLNQKRRAINREFCQVWERNALRERSFRLNRSSFVSHVEHFKKAAH